MTSPLSPQLSIVIGLPVTSGDVLDSWLIVISSGHSMVGGILSNTVITWLHEEELPQASIASIGTR
jgi:hypothetical protein